MNDVSMILLNLKLTAYFNDAFWNGFILNYITYPYVSLLNCKLQAEIEMVGKKAKVATDAT